MTDGDLPSHDDLATEHGADAERHPTGVRSAPAQAAEFRRQEHEPVPLERQCVECGSEGHYLCGCCGMPLCGRHHETQAGFCSHFYETSHALCVWGDDVTVYGGFGREVLTASPGIGRYHLPADPADDWDATLCGALEDPEIHPLVEIGEADLCEDCEAIVVEQAQDEERDGS